MKKITLIFIMLGFVLTANAQYVFNPVVGPTNVAAGAPATINLNDMANSAGVTASSTGSYDSFSITVDWVAGGGNPWSSEADLTFTTSAGSVLVNPPTAGGANSNANATLTFEGDLAGIYDPNVDGYIDLVLNQSFGGSDADWSNITVTLFESPTCVVPTGMATDNLTTTSVDLNWVAGDSETMWNVEYNGGADFTPGNGEEEGSANVLTTPSTSLSGLTEFTQYFVYYQADCGVTNGLSEWVGPFNFLTGYCESMPSSNDGDGITQAVLGNETFTSAGDVVYEDFTSPTVDLASSVTANFQITFATGFTYDVNIWIDFNNDLVFDNTTELVFQGETTNANPTTFDASFVMPNVPLGVYNMRMGSADFGQATPNPCFNGSFGVTADFTVNVTAAPECAPASSLIAQNITETSADLSWTDLAGTGVTWDLEWGLAGFTPGTGTAVTGLTTTDYMLTGLTAGTSYDYYILTNCATTSSTLSGPSNFITATPGETCANAFPMTVEALCDGTNSVTFNFANGGDIDANDENPSCDGFGNFGYFMSFTAPAVGSVVIYFDGAADNIGLEVYDACGGTAVSDCTNNAFDAGDNSGIIGGLTPGNTYVAVIWRDTASGTADVCIEEGPTCPFPSNLDAINIGEDSADLSWTENGTATSWNIEWGPAGFTQGTGTAINGVTTNPFTLTGLTQNTDYDFYVQAICPSETSNFSGPFTFTTTPQSNFTLDCTSGGPLTQNYCYDNGGAANPFVFTFTSNDGTPLNLVFNSGNVENNFDELVVLDSDGTPFPGFAIADQNYGNAGDIGGISFQSTGDSISFFINSDGSVSCASGSASLVAGIDYTVSCATCINPQASYTVIDDCDNGDQFLIDVDIASLGDATSLTISNNIDANTVPVTATGTYQIGPFPFLVDVIVTVSNDQDANCVVNSQPIQLLACPPDNDNPCDATVAVVNSDILCENRTPGTILAATPTGGVADPSCGGSSDDDVWFQFVAENESHLIALANVSGSSVFDMDHSVYEGTCDSLTEISCTSGFDELSSVASGLTIGNTYYIRIYSGDTDAEDTSFDLCITPYIAPVNITCDTADNFCSGSDASDILYTYNTIGILPGDGQIDCLFTTPNPTFSTLEIGNSGDILIEMVQNTAFDENDNPIGDELDVDFLLWGPYAPGDDLCTLPAVVDCSYSAAPVENVTLLGAQSGEIYLLLITNFARDAGVIQVRQTNINEAGAGSTIADIDAEIFSNEVFIDPNNDPSEVDEVSVCGFNSVTIETDSPFADSYIWFRDGFVIPGETGPSITVTESDNYQVQAFDDQCGSNAFSQVVIVNLYREPASLGLQTIAVCDSETGLGEEFDLAAHAAGLNLGDEFTVSYYTSTDDANQAINPVGPLYTSTGETLIMRIEDVNASNAGFLGCRTLNELDLVVGPEKCVFPQGISPGVSPGFNDSLDLSNFDVSQIEIFNRNGTLVYSKTDYTNEWIGQTNSGEELPVGTYFYTITYANGTKTRSNWIYISR